MKSSDAISLRPLRMEDCEKTISWKNDPDFNAMIMSHPFPVTEESEKDWLKKILEDKSNSSIYLGINLNETDELIGYIKLYDVNWIHQTSYLGIIIGPDSKRGKGLGHMAMDLLIDYAFNTLNLRRLVLEAVSYNTPAINLYKKLGFVIEGELVEHFFHDGTFHNVVIMGLIRKP